MSDMKTQSGLPPHITVVVTTTPWAAVNDQMSNIIICKIHTVLSYISVVNYSIIWFNLECAKRLFYRNKVYFCIIEYSASRAP